MSIIVTALFSNTKLHLRSYFLRKYTVKCFDENMFKKEGICICFQGSSESCTHISLWICDGVIYMHLCKVMKNICIFLKPHPINEYKLLSYNYSECSASLG